MSRNSNGRRSGRSITRLFVTFSIKSGRLDLNQRPLGPEPICDDSEPLILQGFTPMLPAACTADCTSEAETANAGILEAPSLDASPQAAATVPDANQGARDRQQGEGIGQGGTDRGSSTTETSVGSPDPMANLAAALLTLSPADRERLAAMLAGQQGEGQRGTE